MQHLRWLTRLPGLVLTGLCSLVRTPTRLIVTAWVMGFFVVGGGTSYADGDGFITPPDLAGGAAQTVFERVPLTAYTVPFGLSDSETSGFGGYFTEGVWQVFRGLANVLLFIGNALVKGALSCMQWMLNLTLYRDAAPQIDSSVQTVAGQVFWPLLTMTLAIAGVTAYMKATGQGAGSITQDLVWIVTACIIAITFVQAPSKFADNLDQVREGLGNAVINGYATTDTVQNPAGYPQVTVQGNSQGAARNLADSMWSVYAVAPWCYTAWGDMNICKDVGHDYLDDTDRWKDLYAQQKELNGADPSQCPAEWQSRCDWVRGQSFSRLGGAVFGALISIPLAVALLALVVFGIMAIIGFLLLLLVGPLFLVFWMIPGTMRRIGMHWLHATLSSLFHNVLIATLLGGVMVLSGIFNAALDKYGLFMVGVLNIVALLVVFKIRQMFDNATGMGSVTGTSVVSSYVAMRLISSAGKGATKLTRGAVGAGAGAAKGGLNAASAGFNQVYNPNTALKKGIAGAKDSAGHYGQRIRSKMAAPTGAPGMRPMATATPYRPAGSGVPSADHQLTGGPVTVAANAGQLPPSRKQLGSAPAPGSNTRSPVAGPPGRSGYVNQPAALPRFTAGPDRLPAVRQHPASGGAGYRVHRNPPPPPKRKDLTSMPVVSSRPAGNRPGGVITSPAVTSRYAYQIRQQPRPTSGGTVISAGAPRVQPKRVEPTRRT